MESSIIIKYMYDTLQMKIQTVSQPIMMHKEDDITQVLSTFLNFISRMLHKKIFIEEEIPGGKENKSSSTYLSGNL